LPASCDEVERHKALTFFFDGVPPLRTETSQVRTPGLKDNRGADQATGGSWHIHEPVKNCTLCHGQQRRAGSARKVQLVAEVPRLCYTCHQEYAAPATWVHGPVATGNCLLCHEPHKTQNEFLLRKPVPELCYLCHEEQAIRQIKNHADESYARCIDCHDGHVGATRTLLRQTFLDQAAPDPATAAQDPAAAARASQEHRSEQAGRMADLYDRSIKQYHAGQMAEAREGFRQILADSSVPGPMKETARTYLEKIEGNPAPPGQPNEDAMK